MKKNIKHIIILSFILAIIVVAQIVPFGSSRLFDALKFGKQATLRELKDFSIRDTASVDRVFMVNKESSIIDLKKNEDGIWIVNNKYEAKQHSVKLMLKTLHLMKIQTPVAHAARENILKRLATKSMKVEVYQHGKLSKTYYIGGPTQSQMGTYAMIEGSDRPFIVEIPGFRGYISSRFYSAEHLWRNTVVFKTKQEEIDRIFVEVGDKPEESFSIKVTGHNKFELFDAKRNAVPNFDSVAVKRYVHEFEVKSFDRFVIGKTEKQIDSILSTPYFYRFKLVKNNGEEVQLSTFRYELPKNDNELDDVEVLNGIIDKKDWVVIQTFGFTPLLKYLGDFKSLKDK